MDDKERVIILETEMEQVKKDLTQILKIQEEIKEQLTRYKGFIGGIIFVGSCLVTLVTFSKDFILSRLS